MSEVSNTESPVGITQLLIGWGNGDRAALDEMLPLVYGELRRLAAYYLKRERANHTLQPTALVHEAYLRLIDQKHVNWKNRAQFFGLALKINANLTHAFQPYLKEAEALNAKSG